MLSSITSCWFLVVSCFLHAYSQQKYPQNLFSSPLDIPLYLSGSFGELRNNHFHSGIDIKTQGSEGKNVYAVADGYVSRIKVSPWGYGKALYITHSNGYTSVYGHLKKYNKEIEEFTKKAQYHKESFDIDLFPYANSLPVKKGDVIAVSGNSGSSAAPHLHFELRESETETIVNPLYFGFEVKDEIKPIISGISLYPLDLKSKVNGKNGTAYYPVEGNYGSYNIKGNPQIRVSGKTGLGISVYDHMNENPNRIGIHKIELKINNEKLYEFLMDKFGFFQTRFINCHIDYDKKIRSDILYQKCFIDDGNRLNNYQLFQNGGKVVFDKEGVNQIKITTSDVNGNLSVIEFEVLSELNDSKDSNSTSLFQEPKHSAVFYPELTTNWNNDEVLIQIPPHSIYDTLYFEYNAEEAKGKFSKIHYIHNSFTPVHSNFELSIKPTSLLENLYSKAFLICIDKNENTSYEGGRWENGYVKAKIRKFGKFCVSIDTIAPDIKPINIGENKNMKQIESIKLNISDNFSGIKNYKGSIDGKWVLMEFDPKNELLIHYFDERTLPGEHIFKLEVYDEKNNFSEYRAVFIK